MYKVDIIVSYKSCKYSKHQKPGKELHQVLQSHDGKIPFLGTRDELSDAEITLQ